MPRCTNCHRPLVKGICPYVACPGHGLRAAFGRAARTALPPDPSPASRGRGVKRHNQHNRKRRPQP